MYYAPDSVLECRDEERPDVVVYIYAGDCKVKVEENIYKAYGWWSGYDCSIVYSTKVRIDVIIEETLFQIKKKTNF